MAHTHDSLDLFCRLRQQHGLRKDAKNGQPVAFVGLQFFLRCDQAAIPGNSTELLEDVGVHKYSVWPAVSRRRATPLSSVVPRRTNVNPCWMSCRRAGAQIILNLQPDRHLQTTG